jgi:hypothetical protein
MKKNEEEEEEEAAMQTSLFPPLNAWPNPPPFLAPAFFSTRPKLEKFCM